jgi:ubiquinone/menaquinone biosynthesis C-methylase UbiE
VAAFHWIQNRELSAGTGDRRQPKALSLLRQNELRLASSKGILKSARRIVVPTLRNQRRDLLGYNDWVMSIGTRTIEWREPAQPRRAFRAWPFSSVFSRLENKSLARPWLETEYCRIMDLNHWQTNWDALGKDDPLWVVLTDDSKRGGKWDVCEFFETGRREIDGTFEKLTALNLTPPGGKALDFGCGVGRLTQALSIRFSEVHGVDISPSMISAAKEFAKESPGCQFHVSASDRLDLFADESFDFVYSNIALQHIEPRYSKSYIKEFIRVLNPGGVSVFQILSATAMRGLFPQSAVDLYRKLKHGARPVIGMFGIPKDEVMRLLTESRAEIVTVETSPMGWRWKSHLFVVRKPPA